VLSNLLEVAYNIVCFFVHVFLTKHKDHISQKQILNGKIEPIVIGIHFRHSKSSIVGVRENVLDGRYHHQEIKKCFPLTVLWDNQLIQESKIILRFITLVNTDAFGKRSFKNNRFLFLGGCELFLLTALAASILLGLIDAQLTLLVSVNRFLEHIYPVQNALLGI
jgi:hypothetical protein